MGFDDDLGAVLSSFGTKKVKVFGSAADNRIKYPDDIDIDALLRVKNLDGAAVKVRNAILNLQDIGCEILDIKAGNLFGYVLHWTPDEVIAMQKVVGDEHFLLKDVIGSSTLDGLPYVKIDFRCKLGDEMWLADGNMFFEVGKNRRTRSVNYMTDRDILLLLERAFSQGRYAKVLKTILKFDDERSKPYEELILNTINGKVGELLHKASRLRAIHPNRSKEADELEKKANTAAKRVWNVIFKDLSSKSERNAS